MIAFFLCSVVLACFYRDGMAQSGATTAQSICDSMGTTGLYSNPDDTTCRQYAKCFLNNNELIGAFYNCTGTTLFNPNSQYCTTGYTCTVTTTTSTSTTATTTTTPKTTTEMETETTTYAPISAQSVCDYEGSTGLYPNPDDTLCKQYAECFENNGSLMGSYYNCSGSTLFDPNLQLCTTGYMCNK